jgi:Fe-S-cluster containining protein
MPLSAVTTRKAELMEVTCAKDSGTCGYCRDACTRKPGWFLPGEAERAAEFLGVPLEEFFRQYLAVDWWEADHRIETTTFVLSPAIEGDEAGEEFPGDPRGTCVFYQDQQCQIHPVKPYECREHWCGDRASNTTHLDAAAAWTGHQDQVAALLGREPEAAEFEGDFFGPFGGLW